MLITRVELKNIKNHAEAEFTFQPGVIAICGPNGSGKTTILEAIAWALFDHLDYKRDDFVKRGAKKGQVAVGFVSDLDEREYVVTRDTGGGYHVYDPATKTRLIEQKNQVLPWLQQHLRVEPGTDLSVLFKTTIGVPQGTFTHDFTLAPAPRKTVFDQILKVEEYRQASDNLRETLRHLESRITEADRKLAEAEGELKAFDETKRQHEALTAQTEQLRRAQTEASEARAQATRTVERFDELQRQREAQLGAGERLRVKLELTKGSLSTAREAAEQARAAAAIVSAARPGYESYLAATARLHELERQRDARDTLRQRLAATERELIQARTQTQLCQERLAEASAAQISLAELTDALAAQTAGEQRLAQLREGRGEWQSLQRSVAALDRTLDKLRQRYTALSKQIEAADSLREKAAQAAPLELARAQFDAELQQKELALGHFRLKREHLATLEKNCARLAAEQEQNQRACAQLTPLADAATRLNNVEATQQQQTELLAKLRAEIARDEEMIRALDQGGICPLLSEKCLNLQPGESLDGRFRHGLEARRHEVETLQTALARAADEVKQMRIAAAEAARLPQLQSEAARLTRELAEQRAQLENLTAELATGAALSENDLQQLRKQRTQIEEQLREARDAERTYTQAEVLRREQTELAQEGEAKRQEYDQLQERLRELGDIEAQLAEAETQLRVLGDPRSRANALQQTIAREPEWRQTLAQAEQETARINTQLEQINAELQTFSALDAELAAANQLRAHSERDYQAFIANTKIADTLSAREQEMESLAADIVETETALATVNAELQRLEAEYDAEQHRRAQTELDHWRERTTQLATQLTHLTEQLQQLAAQLAYLQEVRERLRAHLAAREKAQQLRDTADFIRDILQKAAPYITESYLFSISNEANQLFREITGRFDVTLRWSKEYEITLEEEGRERPFLNLSGGEQMAAALAVRLALLKELSEVNLAFFDEPTTNMDEERRRNLAQQIGRIKDFQQLFVISHDDSFEGFTDQIVMLGQ